MKFVEAGRVEVLVLASKVGKFDYALEDDENGLLAFTPIEFKNKIEQINQEMLKKLAKNTYEIVK